MELTVASFLAVMLATAAVVTLSRGLAAWRVADHHLQAVYQQEKLFSQLGADLRNAVLAGGRPLIGREKSLSFFKAESPTRIVQVEYHQFSLEYGYKAEGSEEVLFLKEWKSEKELPQLIRARLGPGGSEETVHDFWLPRGRLICPKGLR